MDAKKVGQFIQDLRKQKKLTQDELAELLGVTNKAISRWETGDGFPEITMVPKIAHILGVSTDDLLNGQRTDVAKKVEKPIHKLNLFTVLSIIIMISGYIIGVIIGYMLYDPHWPMLPIIIYQMCAVILYTFGRYEFLNVSDYTNVDKKTLMHKTYLIYMSALVIIGAYLPLLIARLDQISHTGIGIGILNLSIYFGLALLYGFIFWLISLIIWLIHYTVIYRHLPKILSNKSFSKMLISLLIFGLFWIVYLNNFSHVPTIGIIIHLLCITFLLLFSIYYPLKKKLSHHTLYLNLLSIALLIGLRFMLAIESLENLFNIIKPLPLLCVIIMQSIHLYKGFKLKNFALILLSFYFIVFTIYALFDPYYNIYYALIGSTYDLPMQWQRVLGFSSLIILPIELAFYYGVKKCLKIK